MLNLRNLFEHVITRIMRFSLTKLVLFVLFATYIALLIKIRSYLFPESVVFVHPHENSARTEDPYPSDSNSASITAQIQSSSRPFSLIQKGKPAYTNILWLEKAVIDPQKISPTDKSDERGEEFKYHRGFLSLISTSTEETLENIINEHITKFTTVRRPLKVDLISPSQLSERNFDLSKNVTKLQSVAFITRIEYANPYWVVVDLVDVYLALNQSGTTNPTSVCILWADNHPNAVIDGLWDFLFPCRLKLSELAAKRHKLLADRLLIRPNRKESIALNHKYSNLEPVETIRNHIYKSLEITNKHLAVNCTRVKVLIVWRRDYQNHPGNVKGVIDRKVANEAEVVNAMHKIPAIEVREVQLDKLTPAEQVKAMSDADIFWAMHGAGHSMSVFMHPGKVVVEIAPPTKLQNWHMEHLSTISGHKHIFKKLPEKPVIDGLSYHISSQTVLETITEAHKMLCY